MPDHTAGSFTDRTERAHVQDARDSRLLSRTLRDKVIQSVSHAAAGVHYLKSLHLRFRTEKLGMGLKGTVSDVINHFEPITIRYANLRVYANSFINNEIYSTLRKHEFLLITARLNKYQNFPCVCMQCVSA